MATITLSNAVYNNAKFYAERHNLSVDEQDILNMPRKGMIDSDDVNGEEARMEYYKKKSPVR